MLIRDFSCKKVPIIALSYEAGQGLPWLNHLLGVEDYLLTPLNGENLAAYLHYLSQVNPSVNQPKVYWLPQ